MKFDNIINNHGKIEREVVDWNLRNQYNRMKSKSSYCWIINPFFLIYKPEENRRIENESI